MSQTIRNEILLKVPASPFHLTIAQNLPTTVATGSVKRFCLEKGDELGKMGDFKFVHSSPGSSPEVPTAEGSNATESVHCSASFSVEECEAELDAVIAAMEKMLFPLWDHDVNGVRKPMSYCVEMSSGRHKRRETRRRDKTDWAQ